MDIRKSHVLLLGTAVFSTLFVSNLSAQLVTASLEGIVTDPSGGVVPSAKVQIINTSTNVKITETTNPEGRFVAPSLQPGGPYTVDVEAPGFKREERTGITLRSQPIGAYRNPIASGRDERNGAK